MSDRETDHCLTKWRPRDWSLPDKVNYFHWSTTESIQKHDQVDNEGSQPEVLPIHAYFKNLSNNFV